MGRPGVSNIFIDMEGFERVHPVMLRRTLLELVAIRYAARGESSIPMARVLADAGMPNSGRAASIIFRAVAQNNVVFIDHPDMYHKSYIDQSEDPVFIECNMWLVARWVSNAGGGDHVYSFDAVPEDIREKMVKELDTSIAKLQSHLSSSPFDPNPSFYVRR